MISITTDIIGLSILGKLHIGSVMVLGHFNDRFNSFNGFKLFLLSSLPFGIKKNLDSRGTAASYS